MGTRIDGFRGSMEDATGEDLRMYLFTRDQLRVLRDALVAFRDRGGHGPGTRMQLDRWVESFDPDWESNR